MALGNYVDVWKLIDKTPPKIEYYINPLIQKNKVTAIFGPGKNFKSSFALYLSLCISTGAEALNYSTDNTGNVLWIDEEMGQDGFHLKLHQIAKGNGIKKNGNLFFSIHLSGFSALNDYEVLKAFILKHSIDIVVIDSITRILGDLDENSSRDIAKLGNTFTKLKEETNSTVIFLHHTPKYNKGTMRGSSDFINVIDRALRIERTPNTNIFKVVDIAIRYGELIEPFEFKITNINNNILINYAGPSTTKFSPKSDEAKDNLLNILSDGKVKPYSEIIKELVSMGSTESTAKKILNDAAKQILVKEGVGYKLPRY